MISAHSLFQTRSRIYLTARLDDESRNCLEGIQWFEWGRLLHFDHKSSESNPLARKPFFEYDHFIQ